jgi:hypothetical protein
VPTNSNGEMPLLDFGDLDRDAMTDMIFYSDGSLHIYYNKYEPNPVTANELCKQPLAGSYLISNPIFTPIADA